MGREEQPEAGGGAALMAAYLRDREDLVRAFAPRLRSREAAEDLVQELGCKLAELGDLEAIERPRAYLHRLAMNLMLDRRRHDRRAGERDGAWREGEVVVFGAEPVAETPSPEVVAGARLELQRLLRALDEAPPKARRAFELHKLEGHSHAETARLMGISRSGVEKHMMAALKLLTARLR